MHSCQPGEEESEECSRQREQQCEALEGEDQKSSTVGGLEGTFPKFTQLEKGKARILT